MREFSGHFAHPKNPEKNVGSVAAPPVCRGSSSAPRPSRKK